MLFRGTGISLSHPHSPPIDILISGALRRAGYSGTRAPGACIFASTSVEQAEGYASDDDRGSLVGVEPLPGAIVSWAPDRFDMLLDFG